MTLKRCSAKECVSDGAHFPVEPMFKFPRDLDRCAVWVKNSGNEKLVEGPSRRLCVRSYLCVYHFEEDQFFDKFRRRLRRNAIPTIFSSMPLSDELMSKFPVLENPLNTLDDEVNRSALNKLCNKYNSFPLSCSRETFRRSETSNRMLSICQSLKTKQTDSLGSAAEGVPSTVQDHVIEFIQEEQEDSHSIIRIPSCESLTNGSNLMPGPGSITYIEGPWSIQPVVDQPISFEIFENPIQVIKEFLVGERHVEHNAASQCEEIIVHHVDVKADDNSDILSSKTHVWQSIPTPCDSANFQMNGVQLSELPILESNQISSEIENILSPSLPATGRNFVIQSKQLTNGGQVCVIPDDVLKH